MSQHHRINAGTGGNPLGLKLASPGKATFGWDQTEDLQYENARKEVAEVDGPGPYFILWRDLLYRLVHMQKEEIHQLLTP